MKRSEKYHPRPLPSPACIYGNGEKYPERIRLGFTDGLVKTYWISTEMPAPHVVTEAERRIMYRRNGGYQYREPTQVKIRECFFHRKSNMMIARLKAIVRVREQEIDLLSEDNAALRNSIRLKTSRMVARV